MLHGLHVKYHLIVTCHSGLVSVAMMMCTQLVYMVVALLERYVSIMSAVVYGDWFV